MEPTPFLLQALCPNAEALALQQLAKSASRDRFDPFPTSLNFILSFIVLRRLAEIRDGFGTSVGIPTKLRENQRSGLSGAALPGAPKETLRAAIGPWGVVQSIKMSVFPKTSP